MDIPRYAPRAPGGPPPSIYRDNPNRFEGFGPSRSRQQSSTTSPTLGSSIPMSIPSTRQRAEDTAPPPLPPPRHVPGIGHPCDPAPFGYPRHGRVPSTDSNASWESPQRETEPERFGFGKQVVGQGITRYHKDEGYHSLNSTISTVSQDSLPKRLFMSHDQFQFNKPSLGGSDYDSRLLKKLDSRRTFNNRSPPPPRSGLSASASDVASQYDAEHHRRHTQLKPLSLPIRSSAKSLIESPGRFTETPLKTSISPQHTAFLGGEYRSPVEPADVDRAPFRFSIRNNSDDATMSTHSSYDETDYSMDEGSGIKRLHIDDTLPRADYQTIGQKRRASSPLGDDVVIQGFPGSSDAVRRREGASRSSPAPRLTVIPQGSYVSATSLHSGLPIMNSFDGRSPGGLSSGPISPVDVISNSPYNTPMSIGHASNASMTRMPHIRNVCAESRTLASPRKVAELPKSSISKIQGGFFLCDCCPKKPKKFATAEELSVHEAEKQYECSFCGNRFKNKNEAERHQNSLHVRRHSWSCSALLTSGFYRAFHDSASRPGISDICGYCGDEFFRSGGSARTRHATEQDWDVRLRHLQDAHKFRECNSSKKFFRADHFRQHLKHSHAGTSGKWTNMLEDACRLEEEPPQLVR